VSELKYKCPECDRSYWAIYRKRTIVEYRLLGDKRTRGGAVGYKGNWKQEQTEQSKSLGLRCMACGTETDGNNIDGCDGIKIDNKGVIFISDALSKFM
jgi:hypothetical protein|tara:strand:- start:2288 stop:2581 length:294 start_codon:yes stop_codon:yes gene_type:complete